MEDYNSNKRIKAYGFGGTYKNRTSHCFPLSLNDDQLEVPGIDGVLDAYENAVENVPLSSPSNFAKVIGEAVEEAKASVEAGTHKYFVLLIITDGIIHDLHETIGAICEGASLPMSIIIAGVGEADFKTMEILDGDNERLSFKGAPAERDIVQFIAMNEFQGRSYSELAEATLDELPRQITSYFGNRDIAPKQPVRSAEQQMQMIHNSSTRMDILPTAEVVVSATERV